MTKKIILTILFLLILFSIVFTQGNKFHWLDKRETATNSVQQIPLPDNYKRIEQAKNSFGNWLRDLPLKTAGSPVLLYDGSKKWNQVAHYAVVNIDVGKKDLQQCADAVMRLKAEYLYTHQKYDQIHFNFTSGDKASFRNWIKGIRPKIDENKVQWIHSHKPDSSYKNFRKYLETVFMYAGSFSLQKELKQKTSISEISVGDIFIQGGMPGHAVIVIDVAQHMTTGEKIFLLAQSYMPAQEIHILRNLTSLSLSPWYSANFTCKLRTPEWTFTKEDLYQF